MLPKVNHVIRHNLNHALVEEELKGEENEKKATSEKYHKIIIFYGKTGAGKSSLANTILEREEFKVGHSLKSCTAQVETAILDWPGIG